MKEKGTKMMLSLFQTSLPKKTKTTNSFSASFLFGHDAKLYILPSLGRLSNPKRTFTRLKGLQKANIRLFGKESPVPCFFRKRNYIPFGQIQLKGYH